MYFLHFLFLFLLFLHADALAFIFFGTSSFGLPEYSVSLLGTCHRVQHVLLSVLVSRLSPAPWLVSRRCSVSHGSAPMRLVGMSSFEGFACAHLCPITAISSALSRNAGTLYLPVIDLAPCGEGGMVASAEEAESSARCQLRQLGPPLCGPPHRQPSPRTPRMGLVRGKTLFKVFFIIYRLRLLII